MSGARAHDVSVVVPVQNVAPYVASALASVLTQSHPPREVIVVDDASTDGTPDVIEQLRDPRLRLVRSTERLGISRALNIGIELASGTFVARMDGDDLAHPERFARQVQFLAEHKHIGVVGTSFWYIDDRGAPRCDQLGGIPTTPAHLGWALHLGNVLAHPSVLVRRTLLEDIGGYREALAPAEDYDLFFRLSRRTELANLPERLMKLRVRDHSASRRVPSVRQATALGILAEVYTATIGSSPSAAALKVLHEPHLARQPEGAQAVPEATEALEAVTDVSVRSTKCDEDAREVRAAAAQRLAQLVMSAALGDLPSARRAVAVSGLLSSRDVGRFSLITGARALVARGRRRRGWAPTLDW